MFSRCVYNKGKCLNILGNKDSIPTYDLNRLQVWSMGSHFNWWILMHMNTNTGSQCMSCFTFLAQSQNLPLHQLCVSASWPLLRSILLDTSDVWIWDTERKNRKQGKGSGINYSPCKWHTTSRALTKRASKESCPLRKSYLPAQHLVTE